jgi:hypothetical protein
VLGFEEKERPLEKPFLLILIIICKKGDITLDTVLAIITVKSEARWSVCIRLPICGGLISIRKPQIN